jgi:hypothetical protein
MLVARSTGRSYASLQRYHMDDEDDGLDEIQMHASARSTCSSRCRIRLTAFQRTPCPMPLPRKLRLDEAVRVGGRKRIRELRASEQGVLFQGQTIGDMGPSLVLPDNMGTQVKEVGAGNVHNDSDIIDSVHPSRPLRIWMSTRPMIQFHSFIILLCTCSHKLCRHTITITPQPDAVDSE